MKRWGTHDFKTAVETDVERWWTGYVSEQEGPHVDTIVSFPEGRICKKSSTDFLKVLMLR